MTKRQYLFKYKADVQQTVHITYNLKVHLPKQIFNYVKTYPKIHSCQWIRTEVLIMRGQLAHPQSPKRHESNRAAAVETTQFSYTFIRWGDKRLCRVHCCSLSATHRIFSSSPTSQNVHFSTDSWQSTLSLRTGAACLHLTGSYGGAEVINLTISGS